MQAVDIMTLGREGQTPASDHQAHLDEAERLMTVCNSCRYCEGLCAVFPAMEMRRSFSAGDLTYLANLCHNCGACNSDCQFAPPHEFDVNVPKVLAEVRNDSYARYVWPGFLAPMFHRNGLMVTLIAALSVAAFVIGFAVWHDPAVMFGTHTGPGAFYKIMPHNTMVAIFGAAFLWSVLAVVMSCVKFWRDIGEPAATLRDPAALAGGAQDAATLKYLDGGGQGCMNESDKPDDNRRLYHHLTFYGFMLCFAATSVGTIWHYLLGRDAPYPWWDLPVVLGTLGGIGITIGPIGLLRAKFRRDPQLMDESRKGMDVAFILMLLLTGVTGLALLFLRATPLMGTMLALHLGFVFGFFITMPYGKFMHGIFRGLALVRYAAEKRRHLG
ncbi:tricarballylate utilization 4Fe-4S protein TcuB [Falsigemmobacter faecalis]|uniref:Tricarballylate utilization 4Fe-4S protein TcuB n=1 Tax=Falsigemmobacter faecalis TaxID=2488730 RepID=A0A3P3D4E5_9RHOB|nr:tricarballylate utilization 4Fe-4S protein TcuB [Falsigemmobacter faecalis]RRH69280.1 tricarballylate utilization 4Fe-4S protein TcuB [Falsigemmobacter faecalis]